MPKERISTAEKSGVSSLSSSAAFRRGLAADPESVLLQLKSFDRRFWIQQRETLTLPRFP